MLDIICYYQFHFTMLEIGLELGINSIDYVLKRAENPKYKMKDLKVQKLMNISFFFCNQTLGGIFRSSLNLPKSLQKDFL